MTIDQENGIQTSAHFVRVTRVIDRDFDLLRARQSERSVWAVRTQHMQEILFGRNENWEPVYEASLGCGIRVDSFVDPAWNQPPIVH